MYYSQAVWLSPALILIVDQVKRDERGDGSSLSVSHDYDNSNQDTAAELGESFICEEKKDISTFLLSRDWLVL